MFFERDDFAARIDMVAGGCRCGCRVEVAPRPFSALALRFHGMTRFSFDNGTEAVSKSGELLYLPSGVGYEAEYSDSDISFFHFYESGSISKNPEVIRDFDYSAVTEYFADAVEIWSDKRNGYRMKATELFYGILAELLNGGGKSKDFGGQSYTDALAKLDEMLFYPELKISDICKEAYISETAFRRSFSKQFGISPVEYILDRRIRKAEILLSSTDLTVDKIAALCGFSDSKYFSRAMRKKRGLSPTAVRKNNME